MSQHLITDFILRPYQYKPLQVNKLISKKLVKVQNSNRHNNSSPEDIEESIHHLKRIKKKNETNSTIEEEQQHIDIII